jgi:hypothetical protein
MCTRAGWEQTSSSVVETAEEEEEEVLSLSAQALPQLLWMK